MLPNSPSYPRILGFPPNYFIFWIAIVNVKKTIDLGLLPYSVINFIEFFTGILKVFQVVNYVIT